MWEDPWKKQGSRGSGTAVNAGAGFHPISSCKVPLNSVTEARRNRQPAAGLGMLAPLARRSRAMSTSVNAAAKPAAGRPPAKPWLPQRAWRAYSAQLAARPLQTQLCTTAVRLVVGETAILLHHPSPLVGV